MSKDFEQAYRELAESEIPDLWDRIEAGLENRSTPEETLSSEKEVSSPKSNLLSGKRRRGGLFSFNRRYSGMVAAALCVAVVIPAAVLLFRIGSGRGFLRMGRTMEGIDTAAPENAVTEAAADEACEAAMEDTAEATAEEMDAGGMSGGAEDLAVAGDIAEDAEASAKEGVQDFLDAGARSEASADMADTGGMTGAGAESGGAESAEEEARDDMTDGTQAIEEKSSLKKENQSAGSLPQEPVEGTVFEHVVIKVEESERTHFDGGIPSSLCTVTVQKAGTDQLKEGEQLTLEIPVHSSLILVENEVFEVDLCYKGDGIYELDGYHGRVEE